MESGEFNDQAQACLDTIRPFALLFKVAYVVCRTSYIVHRTCPSSQSYLAYQSTWVTHCKNTWVADGWCQAAMTHLIVVCQCQFAPAVTSCEPSLFPLWFADPSFNRASIRQLINCVCGLLWDGSLSSAQVRPCCIFPVVGDGGGRGVVTVVVITISDAGNAWLLLFCTKGQRGTCKERHTTWSCH